jgi:hypothetical protein
MGIRDYNASPILNTTLRGVSVAEGMARSDVNNAIRAQMADLKEFVTEYDAGSSTSSLFRQYPRPKSWKPPVDMNNPLKLWIDCDGRSYSFSKSPYTAADWSEAATGITHYYLDYANGSNANAGTSEGQGGAWQTFDYFVANCVDKSVLHCADLRVGYLSNTAGNPAFAAKRVKIIGEHPLGPTLFTSWRETYDLAFLALVADGPAYKSTAAINHGTIMACFDDNYRDDYGLPLAMPHAASLAACKATPGTFFTDGSTVTAWNMIDGRVPDPANGLVPVTSFSNANFTTDTDLTIENCSFAFNGGGAANGALRIRPATVGAANTINLAMKNVRAFGGSGNAFELYDMEIFALENCYGAASYFDIFNYSSFITTGAQAQWCTIYEYNCYGRDAGFSWRQNAASSSSNNLSTAHRGMHVHRVNTAGNNIPNSFIGDVQGCYSHNAGINPTQSQGTAYQYNYWAQRLSSEGSANAKMILIGCNGDAPDASDYHFSNWDDSDTIATLGEIHLADWLGPIPLEKRTGTILKNYETGATL